jgi:hypothetical protein
MEQTRGSPRRQASRVRSNVSPSRSSLAHHNALLYTCQNRLIEIYVHIRVDGWVRGMKPSVELQMTQIMM